MTSTELLTEILGHLHAGWLQVAIAQINSLADFLEAGLAAPSQPAYRELPEAELGKVVWAWTQNSLIDLDQGREMKVDTAFEQAVFIETEQRGRRDLRPVISPIRSCHTDTWDVHTPHWSHAETREQLIADQVGNLAHRADYRALRTLAKLLEERQ